MSKRLTTKMRILNYASEQFLTIGFSNVSVDRIAGDLKMSKSTIYRYFENKDQILFDGIDSYYEELESRAVKIIDDHEMKYADKIKEICLLLGDVPSAKATSQALADMQRTIPEAFQELQLRRKNLILGHLLPLFQKGVQIGFFHKDIDPMMVVMVITSSFEILVQGNNPYFHSPYQLDQKFHEILSLIMLGTVSEENRLYIKEYFN